jgi:hypothetical protein
MPMHDWTRVKASIYHNFHVLWTAGITNRLNTGLLPSGFFAMAEQIIGQPETDVVTLQTVPRNGPTGTINGGVSVVADPPRTRFVVPIAPDQERYVRRANRVVIRHELGDVVAVLEIVSPGNKDSRHSLRTFVEKAVDLIQQGVNLLIVDPFPPGPHDRHGVHQAIWDEFTDQPFELPSDKPLTLAAYQVQPLKIAYVEPIAVGDRLPDMPLFLHEETHVAVPLEEIYTTTFTVLPPEIRRLLEPSRDA